MLDVIIIGAGHNGLTAANVLASAGKKVLILEKNEVAGGLAASYDYSGLKMPGILNDTERVNSTMISGLVPGIKFTGVREPIAFVSPSAQSIVISDNLEETRDSIARISPADAEAYIDYRSFIEKISPFLNGLLLEQQPSLPDTSTGELISLAKKGFGLKRLGNKTMLEFLKVGPMSVADFLNEKFETDFLKACLAAPAIHNSYTGPWSSYTTLNLLIDEAMRKSAVEGGASSLISGLLDAAVEKGVEIRFNSRVDKIQLDQNNHAVGVLVSGEQINARSVLATSSPKQTFEMIPSSVLGDRLLDKAVHLRSRGTMAVMNIAMTDLNWKADIPEGIKRYRMGASLDESEKAFDAIKYREFSKEPILDILVGESDGKTTLQLNAHFVPYELEGGWNENRRTEVKENIMTSLKKVAEPGEIKELDLLTPKDIQERFAIPGGNPYHLEHAVDQMISRPFHPCEQYSTPLKGLFLGGSGSHPGGGLTCMPGYLSAKRLLKIGD